MNKDYINNDYKDSDLTAGVIGAAMEVHGILGNGFQEKIYQRALAVELDRRGIKFIREMEMNIEYKGIHLGKRRVDFFIEDRLMLEIKAVIELEDVHLAQAINYLEAYNVETGLLINFGSKSLQFKRVMKKKRRNHFRSESQSIK